MDEGKGVRGTHWLGFRQGIQEDSQLTAYLEDLHYATLLTLTD